MKKLSFLLAIPLISSCFLFKKTPPPPPPPPEPDSIELAEEQPVTIKAPESFPEAESMPMFPEGSGSMYGFISKNLIYPEEAKENNIAGKVYAEFMVNEDGSITDIKILRGIGGGCDEEVKRVIKLMPNWKPATQNGKPINKKMVIPVNFMLEIKAKPKKVETPTKIENLENWENEEVIEEQKKKRSEAIYKFVEKMPEFPGGEDSLKSYIDKNIIYPEKAKEKGLQGKVYVEFVVEKSGSISNTKVVRGIDNECDYEAFNLVNRMPNWIPGEQRGEKIRVKVTLPISFNLIEENRRNPFYNENFNDVPFPHQMDKLNNDKVDKPTKFVGGEDAMNKFIYSNLNYPEEAKKEKREGKVYASFFVETDGSLSEIKMLRGIGLGCDEEAKRVIKSMPNWTPAEHKGKKVRIEMTIKIEFKLK